MLYRAYDCVFEEIHEPPYGHDIAENACAKASNCIEPDIIPEGKRQLCDCQRRQHEERDIAGEDDRIQRKKQPDDTQSLIHEGEQQTGGKRRHKAFRNGIGHGAHLNSFPTRLSVLLNLLYIMLLTFPVIVRSPPGSSRELT